MTYQPNPINTSQIKIDKEESQLAECLAKNTHEIWVKQKIKDGWKYGPNRDNHLKLHPYLIPYEQLPDQEKEHDYLTAIESIKALLALGYKIEKNNNRIKDISSEEQDKNITEILDNLKNSNQMSISSLLKIQRENIYIKFYSSSLYINLAEEILQLGEPLIAYDILTEGLKYWPDDLELKNLMALALARIGAPKRAIEILNYLIINQGKNNEDIWNRLGGSYKDLWQYNKPGNERNEQLQLAIKFYKKSYEKNHDIYPGINAATMLLLAGEKEQSRNIAKNVKEISEKNANKDYWTLATLGEACLILEEYSSAAYWYQQAFKNVDKKYGNLSSTRKNAKMILDYLKSDLNLLDQWFPMPKVAAFVGHMIDLPNRQQSRFPQQKEKQVYQSILQRLRNLDVTIGYASAACGGDILFLEAILELKGEIHIVLPYSMEEFIKTSVDIIPNSNWKNRFLNLINQAVEVSYGSNCYCQNQPIQYQYTSYLLHGLACIHSKQLDSKIIPMALWDRQVGDGYGGTSTMVEFWQNCQYNVEIISPNNNVSSEQISFNLALPPSDNKYQIMALLFADVVNFSSLNETQIPLYIEHFLGEIAKLVQEKNYEVVLKETWGDALYYVFPSIKDAGNLALAICDLVKNIDWKNKGLPGELNMRISLHAGPVYQYINPITKKTGYSGTHASYAARIEPITPHGKVYASKEFVAFTYVEKIDDFVCDYVGKTSLAKNYGIFPMYHVRRK